MKIHDVDFSKLRKRFSKTSKKIEMIDMNSEKSEFQIGLPENLLDNFSSLITFNKINVFDILDMVDFFQIFVILRNTAILIELNFWLGVDV